MQMELETTRMSCVKESRISERSMVRNKVKRKMATSTEAPRRLRRVERASVQPAERPEWDSERPTARVLPMIGGLGHGAPVATSVSSAADGLSHELIELTPTLREVPLPVEVERAETEEAVAERPPVVTANQEAHGNFLALYFREMAHLTVLRPEEEFQAARRIEEIEIAIWETVFEHVPLIEHLVKVIECALDNSVGEFKSLRRVLTERRRTPRGVRQDRIRRAALRAAARVRQLDIDKRILDAVLGALRRLSRGETTLAEERFPVSARSRSFRRYYAEISRLEANMMQAKNAFVKANLRLVVSIARRFNYGRMPLADLIQEGNIGLIKAVERFDYHRGYRFSTYASWWIRHAISRALADKGREVRLPVHMIDAYHRVARSRRELSGKLGRQPTNEEIAAATSIAVVKIEKMRSYLLDQSFSLDRSISDEDGRKFIEFVTDPNPAPAPSEKLIDQAMTFQVRALLGQLKPIEADILRQRFGLDTDQELTLKQIGEKYHLSRERIRQLQEQALTKMRRALQRNDLM
jgi:RNA polymerase primary sigma factor